MDKADRRLSVSTLVALDAASPSAGSKEDGRGTRRRRSRIDQEGTGETLLGPGTVALVTGRFGCS